MQGVVNDASGQPVTGAFVKLKNDERRLTFMVISQGQGRFEAKDLPPGTYRVQGVGGGFQSAWFDNVTVGAGGEAPRSASSLSDPQGPTLAPAWPQRIPEADVLKASKDPKDLPDGDGKDLVAEKCTSCHNLQRVVVKRSNKDDWEHTVQRMRTRMVGGERARSDRRGNQQDRRTTSPRNFGEVQPYDANSRLPHVLMTGKALHYRAVTYDLVNTHAEPHDVAMDPRGQCLGGGARRQARPPRSQDARIHRIRHAARTGAEGSAEPRQSADRRQGHPVGGRRPQRSLAQLRHQDRKIPRLRLPERQGPRRRQQHGAASGRHGLGDRRQQGSAAADPEKVEFKFYPIAERQDSIRLPGAYGIAVAGDGSVW